jgi:HEAT repeat protein
MVRAMAAAALGKIGGTASAAVGALTTLLEDAVFPVRFWACDALGRIGGPARPARAALEARTRDEHKAVRAAAVRALRRIDAETPSAAGREDSGTGGGDG